jgi:hypothetical protein
MPALDFDEIPRCAGQYFRSVGVHGNIIFNANSTDTRRIYTRFDGDYVPGLQAFLLPARHPGVFVHFKPQPMTRAVNEEIVEAIPRKDLPRRTVYVLAGCTRLRSGYRRPLGL